MNDRGTRGDGIEIRIDQELCMGSGNCSFHAPGVFDLADEGYAIVVDPDGADVAVIQGAIEGCPVGAISLWRDDAVVTPGRS